MDRKWAIGKIFKKNQHINYFLFPSPLLPWISKILDTLPWTVTSIMTNGKVVWKWNVSLFCKSKVPNLRNEALRQSGATKKLEKLVLNSLLEFLKITNYNYHSSNFKTFFSLELIYLIIYFIFTILRVYYKV